MQFSVEYGIQLTGECWEGGEYAPAKTIPWAHCETDQRVVERKWDKSPAPKLLLKKYNSFGDGRLI
jgi:hypothetical protein